MKMLIQMQKAQVNDIKEIGSSLPTILTHKIKVTMVKIFFQRK